MQASDKTDLGNTKSLTFEPEEEQETVPDLAFYSFPTLEQLSAASEAALRAEGFGYRSAFLMALPLSLLNVLSNTNMHLLETFGPYQ